MARSLSPKQREKYLVFAALYMHRVWPVSASRDRVELEILENGGEISTWIFFEESRHFTFIKMKSGERALQGIPTEMFEFLELRALELVFAIRNNHQAAMEYRRAKKATKEAAVQAKELRLPFELHTHRAPVKKKKLPRKATA